MLTRNRRDPLDGLTRILDAGGLEELFAGPDDEAIELYELLLDVARGREARCWWQIGRIARRRGITSEFVADRAAVLLAAMEERRRTDLYRILGAPPLASEDMLRQRWLDFAKVHHPDAGGDAARFRQVKEAWEVLRDPARRAEYERFWVRALGPLARVVPPDDDGVGRTSSTPRPPGTDPAAERRVVVIMKKADLPGAAATAPPAAPASPGSADAGLAALVARLEAVLAPVAVDQLAQLRAEVDDGIARLEGIAADLDRLLRLKRALD